LLPDAANLSDIGPQAVVQLGQLTGKSPWTSSSNRLKHYPNRSLMPAPHSYLDPWIRPRATPRAALGAHIVGGCGVFRFARAARSITLAQR
jgi:hypothetical protein